MSVGQARRHGRGDPTKLKPTKTEAIFLHLPLRSSTLPEPLPSHSTIPHYPTLNTSETLASILIPPFPLTPILYICKIHQLPPTLPPLNPTLHPLPISITIASSYIIPLFDYCNSLLFNFPEYKLIKLHRLQNAAVLCVHVLPRRYTDSITSLLRQLH